MSGKTFTRVINGQEVTIETGKLAQMANGSVVVTIGETTILATAVMSRSARPGIGFLPLMVNYQEKMYAAGMIKSSRFMKRESRPSDDKILMSRLIDRQLRPLFPKHIHNDIQVMLTTLSYDGETEHDMVSAIAASAALAISDIPWNGPTACVRVALDGENFIANPTRTQREGNKLDLIVAASASDIVMIEAAANEVEEEQMVAALEYGKSVAQEICGFISDIASEIGKTKIDMPAPEVDQELHDFIASNGKAEMEDCIYNTGDKLVRFAKKDEIKTALREKAEEHFGEEREIDQFDNLFEKVFGGIIRTNILENETRINGRKLTEIRPLSVETSVLKRTHGSAVFQRGETQGLGVLTLAAPGNELIVDGIEGEGKKRYMHHYNFPPFSVGEASNRLFTGNREIGHGALAERAIEPMLPSQADFPYIMRVVTEILQSNGSSSMAATCCSTLALMDGGVPLKKPVAGIAMGLMTDGSGNFKVLTDLQDEEDFGGDMDFKVAGTPDGITAIQMDVKIPGIAMEIFKVAFAQAKQGRMEILGKMAEAIAAPRSDMSPYAPRLTTLKIHPDKIREVIGKGGETINGIIDATGVEINIEDDGTVVIASNDGEASAKAVKMVEDIAVDPEPGEVHDAVVARVEDYGCFVDIKPGFGGLVHVSLMAEGRVEDPRSMVKPGDVVRVKYMGMDEKGRKRLSMKDAAGEAPAAAPAATSDDLF